MQLCSLGYLLTHTCDDVGQAGVKVLQQLTDRVNEEEGIIVAIQQPTVLSFIRLHVVINSFVHSFVGWFAHSFICMFIHISIVCTWLSLHLFTHPTICLCIHAGTYTPIHPTATACKAGPQSFHYCRMMSLHTLHSID